MKPISQNSLIRRISEMAIAGEEATAVPSITFRLNVPAPGLQGLSLFRILFGLLLLYNLVFNYLPYFDAFFSDQGIYPRVISWDEHWGSRLSVLEWVDAPWQRNLFCMVYGLALVCFIIGYRTAIAKWVVFVGLVSLFHRNDMIDSGFDVLIRVLMLWGLFVPLNRYWSVDSALTRSPRDMPVPTIFLLAIELQICILYFFSGLFKLMGPAWLSGVAPGWAMQNGAFGSEIGIAVLYNFPYLIAPVAYGTIAFQLMFPLLVFSPVYNNITRSIAILGGFALHFSFLFLLTIGLFPVICIIYLVLLVPDRWVNALLAPRRARLEKITLYFDPGCGFCEKTALLLRELCLSPFTRVLPASHDPQMLELLRRHNSWVVRDDQDGKIYLKWEAVSFVLRRNPFTWILGAASDLFFLKAPMRGLYEWIGRNRPALGRLTAALLPFREIRPTPAFFKYVCGALITVSLTSNVLSLPQVRVDYNSTLWLQRAIIGLQLNQSWMLFAPSPTRSVYSHRLLGFDADGDFLDITDVFEDGVIHKSRLDRLNFANVYWQKYYSQLFSGNYSRAVGRRLAMICETYNREHPEAPLSRVSLYHYDNPRETLAWPGPLKPSYSQSLDCPVRIQPGA